MSLNDYEALASEVNFLESLLAEIPEENPIERMGFEARLESARIALAELPAQRPVYKARLTFRGRPVRGSHGIAADFAARAAGAFTDAVTAIAGGIDENLRYMGPIPDKQKHQLLITGTALGSFGFEFELPQPEPYTLFPEPTVAENALKKMQQLFELSADGSDDDVAELVDEIHPRAVKKVAEFMDYLSQHEAWCGLEFNDRFFRFQDIAQLSHSANRLKESNIREGEETLTGEFLGVLPVGRTFEFKIAGNQQVIRGKIGPDIEDADVLNREYLHKLVQVRFHVIQVGQGRPRHTLCALHDIERSAAM